MIKISLLHFGLTASAFIASLGGVALSPRLALSPADIDTLAEPTTVRVQGQNPGSGVIFNRQGDRYSVLTAKHVLATPDEYEIVTSDGSIHTLDYNNVHPVADIDLAVAEFESSQNYQTATLGDSDQVFRGDSVFIASWPHAGRALPYIYQFITVNVSSKAPVSNGYELVYTGTTRRGMSGGPVFDSDGEVVGIHGRAEGVELFEPNSGEIITVGDDFSLAVPINNFLTSADDLPIATDTLPVPESANASPVLIKGSPRLESVRVVNNLEFRESEYLFHIDFPAEAEVPLETIVFEQSSGRDYPSYSIRDTHAYEGGDRSADLALGIVVNDSDEKTMTVVFDPPVQPGRQITVALKAHRNPRDDTYQYRVSAIPPGATARRRRIGTGRLRFYESSTFGF